MGLGRMSIATRFALVFLLAFTLVGAAFYLILDHIYLNQLKSQAETVADNVDAFGTWVAQYGRVWVKEDATSYLGHLPLLQADDAATTLTPSTLKPVNFYSKNPALAQREFSEVVARLKKQAKFRLTSHNVMNRANTADPFESAALQRIREAGLKEYYELTPEGFRYARTLWSVGLSIIGGWQLGMIVGAFLIAMLFVRFAIVNPVKRLTKATHQISLAQAADLGVSGFGRNSRNELHQLAIAIDRLRRSVHIAMRKLGEERPAPAGTV